MINEQIILWIVRNRHVYFGDSSIVDLEVVQQQTMQRDYERIISIMKKQIPYFLKEHGSVRLEGFISFRMIESKELGKYCLEYQIEYPLNLQMGKNKEYYRWKTEKDQLFIKRISSLLLMEKEYIGELIKIFGKSINDLITNESVLKLNLDFCLIKLRRNQMSCKFSKDLIQQIQQQQQNQPPKAIRLNLCSSKCPKANNQNLTTKATSIYSAKLAQIKDGNLFNHPSILQIKSLYDRGRQLQLKYKHLFD